MTADLRQLDAEIARLRGWFTTDLGTWTPRNETEPIRRAWEHCIEDGRENDPPPFSSSWALAGPLLEEILDASPDSGELLGDLLASNEYRGARRRGRRCAEIAHWWLQRAQS